MTEHSCLRCRDYEEKLAGVARARDFHVQCCQQLDARLMVTECVVGVVGAILVFVLLFGGG